MEIHFGKKEVFRPASVNIPQILRKNFIKEETAQRGFHNTGYLFSLRVLFGNSHFNSGVKGACAIFVGQYRLVYALVISAFACCAFPLLGHIVNTEHHILRGYGNRPAVGGL